MSSIDRAAIVAEARSWIGTPYHYRAAVKGVGCDCVGLINAIRAWVIGGPLEPMPAYSPDFASDRSHAGIMAAGRRFLVPKAPQDRLPGDVVAFRWRRSEAVKHAGVLVTPTRMVHADMRAGVTEVSTEPWVRMGSLAAVFGFPGVG